MRRVRRLVGILAALLALVVVLVCGLGTLQRPRTAMPPGVSGRHVDVGGVPIRYLQAGAGPDVLLIHGSPGWAEDWEPVFERLTRRFRVTAFDRHGHGFSGGADLPHTPAENARVTLGVIRALGLRDVTLVGHSYGGVTGLHLATGNPEEVRSYVLVSA